MNAIRKSVFKKLLLSFIAVYLVPVIIAAILFTRIELIMINDAEKVNIAMLEQVRQVMDNRFKEVEQLSVQISSSPELDKLLHHPIESNYQYVEFSKELLRYQISNTFINEYFVYLSDPEVVLSQNMKVDSGLFFNYMLNYKNIAGLQSIKNRLSNVLFKEYFPIEKINSNFKEKEVITYVQSLTDDLGEDKGSILIIVNEHQIRELIQQIEGIDQGIVYIINDKDEIVMSTADTNDELLDIKAMISKDDFFEDYKIDGEEIIISSTHSSQNDWTYVSMIPEHIVLAQVNSVKNWAIAIAIFSLIIGVVVCYYLANKNYQPIHRMVQTILKTNKQSKTSDIDEMEFINHTLESSFYQQEQLNKLINQQKPIIKKDFIYRLLKGQVDENTIKNSELEFMDIQFKSNLFRTLLIQINAFNKTKQETEIALSRYLVLKFSEEIFDLNGYVIEIERDQIVILLNGKNEIKEKGLVHLIAKFKKILEQEFQISTTITVSQWHKDIVGIATCFREIKKALDHQIIKGKNSIIYFQEIKDITDYRYDLPMETNLKLFNFAKSGDLENVQNCLDVIFTDILKQDSLTPELSRYLSYDLLNTWFKVLKQLNEEDRQHILNLKNPFEFILSCHSIQQMQSYIITLFTILCDKVNASQIDQKKQLYQDLVKYIEDNYRDDTFSLQLMADHFGMNASYLSSFFKKSGHVNISDYLTQLRLTESKKLLTDTKLTIAEIAEKIGYTSSVVFIRVFKRKEGIPPGKYRQTIL